MGMKFGLQIMPLSLSCNQKKKQRLIGAAESKWKL
jgi:hypothetical protein